MAISVTGTTGTAATIKTSANMASASGLDNAYPAYHFVGPGGQRYTMRQGAVEGPGVNILEFTAGGQSGEALIRLTPQNVNDLLAGLVNFANNGVLS